MRDPGIRIGKKKINGKNAITENNRAIQTKLEKVLNYTKQTMVAYMSEEDLNRICAYIVEYSSEGVS